MVLPAGCQTFHRAQSMTWKHTLCVHLDSAFGDDAEKAQQLYVALSRATKLENTELYGTLTPAMLKPSAESVTELQRQRGLVVDLARDFPRKADRGAMNPRLWMSNRKPRCMADAVRSGTKSVIVRPIGYQLRGTGLRMRDIREGDTVVLATVNGDDINVSVTRVTVHDHATEAIAAETPLEVAGIPHGQARAHAQALKWFEQTTYYYGGKVVALQVELAEVDEMEVVEDRHPHLHLQAAAVDG